MSNFCGGRKKKFHSDIFRFVKKNIIRKFHPIIKKAKDYRSIYQSVHRSKLTTVINRSFLRLPLFYRPTVRTNYVVSSAPAASTRLVYYTNALSIHNKLRGRARLVLLEPSQKNTEEVRLSFCSFVLCFLRTPSFLFCRSAPYMAYIEYTNERTIPNV